MLKHFFKALLCVVIIFQSSNSHGQITAQPTLISKPVPLGILYQHFFLYVAHVEHFTEAHPGTSPGGSIRDHLRKKTGLTEAEWKLVAAASLRVESSVHTLRDQSRALIAQDRKACAALTASCSKPSLPRVGELDKQREHAVTAEAAALDEALGTEGKAKLRAYLHGEMSSHIKAVPQPAANAIQPAKAVQQ